jgi:predicted type IV restriction endonuclease
MLKADVARDALLSIREDFKAFCEQHGQVTEADTRAQVIDRILTEVCGWPEGQIVREPHVDRGFMDYCLVAQGRKYVAVEAKREGVPFSIPIGKRQRNLAINGTLLTDVPIKEAIEQVRGYCDDGGIRYAVATNGYAWVVFRAIREDMPWRKGHAKVFASIDDIFDHFTEFWNILSYEAISLGSLDAEFGAPPKEPRRLRRVLDDLYNADLPLTCPPNPLHG